MRCLLNFFVLTPPPTISFWVNQNSDSIFMFNKGLATYSSVWQLIIAYLKISNSKAYKDRGAGFIMDPAVQMDPPYFSIKEAVNQT